MDELDELLAALKAAYRNNDVNAQALLNSYIMPAYRAYKAAPSPLVLEAVKRTDKIVKQAEFLPCNAKHVRWCETYYKLPNGGET